MNNEIETLTKELKNAIDQAKGGYEDIKGRMEKGEKLSENLRGDMDELLSKFNVIGTRMDDLEQKAAREPQNTPHNLSLGQMLVSSDSFKSAGGSNMGTGNRIHIMQKATLQSTGNVVVAPERNNTIMPLPQETLTVRALFAQGTTNSNAYQFVQESGFDNKAKATKEGDLLPESNITFAMKSVTVEAIGHTLPISQYLLDDVAGLQSFIDNRMIYGVKHQEDRQLLNGDGLSPNIQGVLPQASAFAAPSEIAEYTIIDQLRLAALQGVWAEYPMSGFVIHPVQWAQMELMKDSIGRYIIGNPQGSLNATLWGLPVVQSHAMAKDGFLVGAFKHAAEIKDRQEISVEIGYVNDNFSRNQLTIKAYERLALAVYRPEAFVKGTLAAKTKV